MQKTVDFLSFILSVLIYLVSLILILYVSSNVVNLENVKYTDDINATRDQVTIADIDDLIPAAPDTALEKVSDVKTDTKEELVDEEKLKTTHKKVDQTPKPKQEAPKKEEPKPELKKEEVAPSTKDEIKKPEEPKEEPKEPKKEEPKPEVNPLDLFASIDDKKLSDAVKSEDAIQSKKKSDKETKTSTNKSTSSQKSDKKAEKSSGRTMSTGEYNKFKGEIQNILTRIWSTYRAIPNQDATVEITIDANGRASYRNIELAYDTAFNQKFRDFLSKIESIEFPKPPNGQSFTHKYKMMDLIQ